MTPEEWATIRWGVALLLMPLIAFFTWYFNSTVRQLSDVMEKQGAAIGKHEEEIAGLAKTLAKTLAIMEERYSRSDDRAQANEVIRQLTERVHAAELASSDRRRTDEHEHITKTMAEITKALAEISRVVSTHQPRRPDHGS
jgi:hypothetical protein